MKPGQTLRALLAALLPLCTLAPGAVHAQSSAHDTRQTSTQTSAQTSTPAPPTAPRTARYCTNCATVEAVRVVDASGEGKAAAAMGSGSGRTAATAAGGAGSGAEPGARRTQRYEVIVRYASNGTAQTLQYDNDPGFRTGDAVRVNNGVLSRDQ